ncbi:MAG: hypothetical protein KF862_25505 [Chitinophagaceae bacterium]|nr:hypothetical protein [Chitinophagaceae bacterium]
MQKWICFLLSAFVIAGCNQNRKVPDVSGIEVKLEVQRFEQDFFSIDTNNIRASLPALHQKYPLFLADFVQNILGLSITENGGNADSAIKMFIRDYRVVKDTADKVFKNMASVQEEIKQGIRFARYYFPQYEAPEKLITFIGPLDAIFQTAMGKTGDVITQDALAAGLQLHLGKNASLYQGQTAQSIFPTYVSRKFEPSYIAVNCIKNIVDDVFPVNPGDKTLLDLMVDKGKRLYLLDKFLPFTADSLKTGYTQDQLQGCYKNEGFIWSFIIQNDLIYNSDPLRIQSYVEEGPYTQELGEGSPGNISLFTGWQIVKKYMEMFPDTSPETLLSLNARQILQDSKYKPK